MSCTDAEDEFADTHGDVFSLWVGGLGLVVVAGLGVILICIGLLA